MERKDMIKLAFATFALVTLSGVTNALACDFSEGSDQNIPEDKIVNSAPIHTRSSVEAMYSEEIPYDDKMLISRSSIIHKTTGTVSSEGISDEEL